MSAPLTDTIELAAPLDLEASLRILRMGGGDLTQRLDASHFWKATRTPEGPATLHLARTGPATFAVEIWGEGAPWLRPHVPGILGVHDDRAALDALLARLEPGLLHQLVERFEHRRLVRVPWLHEVVVQNILQQKVSSTQAFGGYRHLARFHGEPAPGPGELRLPVAPRLLAHLPADVFTSGGIDRQRAETLRAASLVYRRIDEMVGWSFADARARLGKVRGIGPWTVESVLLQAFGDPDALPLGDFHLPNTVAWGLAQEARADDARMVELLEPYRGQRGRITMLLEAGGYSAPRFGPRLRLPGPPRWRR